MYSFRGSLSQSHSPSVTNAVLECIPAEASSASPLLCPRSEPPFWTFPPYVLRGCREASVLTPSTAGVCLHEPLLLNVVYFVASILSLWLILATTPITIPVPANVYVLTAGTKRVTHVLSRVILAGSTWPKSCDPNHFKGENLSGPREVR